MHSSEKTSKTEKENQSSDKPLGEGPTEAMSQAFHGVRHMYALSTAEHTSTLGLLVRPSPASVNRVPNTEHTVGRHMQT